jgi:hypothetical protein
MGGAPIPKFSGTLGLGPVSKFTKFPELPKTEDVQNDSDNNS